MKKILLTGILFAISGMHAVELQTITPITQEELEKEQIRIETLLYRHKVALYAFGGVAAVGAGLVLSKFAVDFAKGSYSVGKSVFGWCGEKIGYYPVASPENVDSIAKTISLTQEQWKDLIAESNATVLEKAFSAIDSNSAGKFPAALLNQYYEGKLKASLFKRMMHGSSKLVKNIGSVTKDGVIILSPFVAKAAFIATMNHVRGYFAHANSLPWYIGYEANYVKYCNAIIDSIRQEVVEPCPVDAYGRTLEHSVQEEVHITRIEEKETLTDDDVVILQVVSQELMMMLTRICAFMEYRMGVIEEKRQFAAQGCKQYIFNSANLWARDMQEAFVNKDAQKVLQITARLKADVTSKASMFALIDSEEDIIQEVLMALSMIG